MTEDRDYFGLESGGQSGLTFSGLPPLCTVGAAEFDHRRPATRRSFPRPSNSPSFPRRFPSSRPATWCTPSRACHRMPRWIGRPPCSHSTPLRKSLPRCVSFSSPMPEKQVARRKTFWCNDGSGNAAAALRSLNLQRREGAGHQGLTARANERQHPMCWDKAAPRGWIEMNLPMSWDEWADHDGVALAARVSKGELTAAELAAQAAAGIARVDPALSGVVEVFEDAVADPASGRHQSRWPLCRFAVPDEGSGAHHEGPPAGNGLADHARQSRHGRYVHDQENARGRPQSDRAHHHAGIRGLQLGGKSRRVHHAQPLEYRLHHLRIVGRQRRHGRSRHCPDRACDRRRRLDPDSRRRQRQHRPESIARRILAVPASVRPERAGLHSRLPVAHGARHRRFRRCLPRPSAGRIHAVLEFRRNLTHG